MKFFKMLGCVVFSTSLLSTASMADSRLSLLQQKIDSCNDWYAEAQKQYNWFGNVWKNGARGYKEVLLRGDVIVHEDYDIRGSGIAGVTPFSSLRGNKLAAVKISCVESNDCVQIETQKWTADGQSKGERSSTSFDFLVAICPSNLQAEEISSLYNNIYP